MHGENIGETVIVGSRDERISWIIFSPGEAGSITGSDPLTYKMTIASHANYVWQPSYQPQIIGTIEAIIKKESDYSLTMKDRQDINSIV